MKPNVIVICVDTFRADLGDGGGKLGFVRTPNVDRLRAESVAFTRCFGEGEPTIPVRRCLFTGVRSFPWRFETANEGLQPAGSGWHPIPHEHDTLAERLHDAGWLTGFLADTYHMFKPTMNFTRGFVSWEFIRGQENDPWRSGPHARIDLAAHVPEGEASPALHPTVAQYLLNALGRRGEEDWQAAQLFRTAARWVEENRRNAPFFLWIDSFSPHELWDPPRHYADAYCPPKPGVKDYIYPQVFHGKERQMTLDEAARCKALYCGFVTFVDRWIGHLLAALDALRLWDDTIAIFLSDHGTELLDKGFFGKAPDRLYPYNTQLNWLIRHPAGPRGTTCDAWTQNQDFLPTLLALLGVPHPPLDGHNVWPTALAEAPPIRDHVITGWGPNACVRDADLAVHLNATTPDFARSARVFDLRADPDETTDVATQHPDAVQQAVERLAAVTGPLPVTFTQYRQRHMGRTMRSFAPLRFRKAGQ
jgi:arylsulfatase A-like enzyme